MNIPITEELKEIFKEIIDKDLSIEEWGLIESDDMFQTKLFEGGFDNTEREFTFSYYGEDEYWFQLSLDTIQEIIKGVPHSIIGRRPTN